MKLTNTLRVCLELCLKKRAYKSKKAFGQNLYFQVFVKIVFWPFLGFLTLEKAFNFLPNEYLFFQTGFLSIKNIFRHLKRNPKQVLTPIKRSHKTNYEPFRRTKTDIMYED